MSPNELWMTNRADCLFSYVWDKCMFQGGARFLVLLNSRVDLLHEPQHGNVGIAKRLWLFFFTSAQVLFFFLFGKDDKVPPKSAIFFIKPIECCRNTAQDRPGDAF